MNEALESAKQSSQLEDDVEKGNCDHEDTDVENYNSDSEQEGAENGDNTKTTKNRGLTKLLNIFKSKKLTKVDFNENGQPDSRHSDKLGSFLGLIARNGQVAPLNFADWRAMPAQFKNIRWQIIKNYFIIPLEGKKWVMMSLGRKWGNFKCELKRLHYDVHDNDVDRFADRDPRVHPERCLKNKNSRAKQKTTHTSGRKSFARMKRKLNKEPKRHELFIRTHTRKNGEPLDEHSKEIMDTIQMIAENYPDLLEIDGRKDDLFGQIVGEDKHGHVSCYGLGPSPSDVWGEEISRTQALRMLKVSQTELSDVRGQMEIVLKRLEYLEEKAKKKKDKSKNKHSSDNLQVDKRSKRKDSPQHEVPSSKSSHEVDLREVQSIRKSKKAKIRHNRQSQVEARSKANIRSLKMPHKLVAIGTVVSKDPSRVVGGVELGHEFWEVLIEVPKMLEEPLVRCYKNYKTIHDAIGISVAWPYTYVEEF